MTFIFSAVISHVTHARMKHVNLALSLALPWLRFLFQTAFQSDSNSPTQCHHRCGQNQVQTLLCGNVCLFPIFVLFLKESQTDFLWTKYSPLFYVCSCALFFQRCKLFIFVYFFLNPFCQSLLSLYDDVLILTASYLFKVCCMYYTQECDCVPLI